jgi:hypothetical protein
MDYKKAAEIRRRGLLSLIAENKFQEGKGLGESIGSAISQKFKAKSVGIKEKFDPLNIISKMTGKGTFGKIATTIAGRAMGKSESDIGYFGGYAKKRKYTYKNTKVSPLEYNQPMMQSTRDPIAGILGEMYQFMQQTYEVDKKDFEIQQAFLEEQNSESENRHKQLVRAIKKYVKVPSKPEEKTESGGMLDFIMDFIKKIKDEIMSIIQPVLDFFDKIGKFGWLSYLLNPVGIGLAALLASIGISAYLLQKLADATPNMKALSPKEAYNVLSNAQSEEDIKKSGGQAKLEDTITNGRKNAEAILAMPEGKDKDKAIIDAGGMPKIKEIIDDTKEYTIPEKREFGPEKVKSKEEFVKHSRKTKVAAAQQWDNQFGEKYNEDGTKKTPALETDKPVPVPMNVPSPSTEPAASVTIPKTTTIPIQTNAEVESNSTEPVIAMNSTTNNIGGSKPQTFNTSSVKVRNDDLRRHNYRLSVPV